MKKRGLWILILLSTVFAVGIAVNLLWKPDPIKLLQHGLEELYDATSFRYTMVQHQNVEGENRLYYQISGEQDNNTRRIFGEVVGTQVEMVFTPETLYMQDPFTKRWVHYPTTPESHQVFLAELDPITSLQFKELGEVLLQGTERIKQGSSWVVQFQPTVQNQLMEDGWTDFKYMMFIGKSNKLIHRVIIEAKSKTNSQLMSMTLEFEDYGEKIDISLPN